MDSAHPMTRPIGITIVAIVFVIGLILNIAVGTDLLGLTDGTPASERGELAVPVGAVLLMSGVLELVAAYGLWTLRPWGWTLAVVLMAAAFVKNILQYLNDNSLLVAMVVSAIVPALILWYLFRPHVRSAFRRG